MADEERIEVTIVGTGERADGPVRLVLDYPYVGEFDEAISSALEAARNAGLLHEAIDRVEITAVMTGG